MSSRATTSSARWSASGRTCWAWRRWGSRTASLTSAAIPDCRAPVRHGEKGVPGRISDLGPVRGADHRRLRRADRGQIGGPPDTAPQPEAAAPAPAAPVHPSRADASGRGRAKAPFFLVAGMFGNVLNLRHLAQLVGGDRPFYGLQARGLVWRRQAAPRFRAEAATDYIAEMRQVQPQGPYLLGGFSGGGLIAWEMARQLQAAGEDGVALDAAGYAVADAARAVAAGQGVDQAGRTAGQGAGLSAGMGAGAGGMEAASGQTRHRPGEGGLPQRRDRGRLPRRPAGLSRWPGAGATVLFRPPLDRHWQVSGGALGVAGPRNMCFARQRPDPIRPRLEVIEVPGDHDSMVLEPNVRVMAARLKTAIAAAEGQGAPSSPWPRRRSRRCPPADRDPELAHAGDDPALGRSRVGGTGGDRGRAGDRRQRHRAMARSSGWPPRRIARGWDDGPATGARAAIGPQRRLWRGQQLWHPGRDARRIEARLRLPPELRRLSRGMPSAPCWTIWNPSRHRLCRQLHPRPGGRAAPHRLSLPLDSVRVRGANPPWPGVAPAAALDRGPPIPECTTRVDWLAGASLMMRQSVLDRIGLFDETFFLYFEETDLCHRAARAGWPTDYVLESRVAHIGSASTGMKTWARIPQFWLDSRLHYFHQEPRPALCGAGHAGRVGGRQPVAAAPAGAAQGPRRSAGFLRDLAAHHLRQLFTPGNAPPLRQPRRGARTCDMTLSFLLIGNETLTTPMRRCPAQPRPHHRRRGHAGARGRPLGQRAGPARRTLWRRSGRPLGRDWLLSVANLTVLAPAVLARAHPGAVNFHDGPLPAHAGLNAPVWAILAPRRSTASPGT
jgi:hypothetical protein